MLRLRLLIDVLATDSDVAWFARQLPAQPIVSMRMSDRELTGRFVGAKEAYAGGDEEESA